MPGYTAQELSSGATRGDQAPGGKGVCHCQREAVQAGRKDGLRVISSMIIEQRVLLKWLLT